MNLLNILDADGLTPDSARLLNAEATALFADTPCVSAAVGAFVFGRLSSLWDDNQAIPTASFQRVQQSPLLALLKRWLQSESSFSDQGLMDQILREFQAATK